MQPDGRRGATVSSEPGDRRGTALALVLLVALGAVVRFWDLGAARLNYDESFTAMAGRLPVGSLFDYLRRHDSHPPLDYLLRAPLARAGVSEFWFRAPSAILSLGAVALLAWWMRERGRFGLIATALMAVSAFEAVHGREARMYAELELLGVAIAVLAYAWLAAPRRWHAPVLGILVFVGLVTHVSMFLLAAGLLALPGHRSDRDASRWRAAIVLAVGAWVAVWGRSFAAQARGGHSSWIPPTTASRLAIAVGHVISFEPTLAIAAAIATIAGGLMIWNRDVTLGRVWLACAALPIAIAAVAGRFEPVVLDRTFTLMAWAPCLALACLVDALASARRVLGVVALVGMLVVMVPTTLRRIQAPTGPDRPLRQLAHDVKPGDVVAVRPASKAPEIAWSLGVREHLGSRQVPVPDVPKAFGIELGAGPESGRVWLLDWRTFRAPAVTAADQCAPRWARGHPHIRCLRDRAGAA